VLTRDHTVLSATHTFIHKWNEPCLPLLPSNRASSHFGGYSFPFLAEDRRLSWPGWLGGILKGRAGSVLKPKPKPRFSVKTEPKPKPRF